MDITLYIGSLLVGGIAGLTLTSTAFQRPQKLVEQYRDRCASLDDFFSNVRAHPGISESVKEAAIKSAGLINIRYILKAPLPLVGVFAFEVLEVIVMLLFLFAEIALLAVYFDFDIAGQAILSAYQLDLLTKGYILLFLAILLITLAHVLALVAASEEFRRRRKLMRLNISIVDITSQDQLYAMLMEENMLRPIA